MLPAGPRRASRVRPAHPLNMYHAGIGLSADRLTETPPDYPRVRRRLWWSVGNHPPPQRLSSPDRWDVANHPIRSPSPTPVPACMPGFTYLRHGVATPSGAIPARPTSEALHQIEWARGFWRRRGWRSARPRYRRRPRLRLRQCLGRVRVLAPLERVGQAACPCPARSSNFHIRSEVGASGLDFEDALFFPLCVLAGRLLSLVLLGSAQTGKKEMQSLI